jgi:hypothetical protein
MFSIRSMNHIKITCEFNSANPNRIFRLIYVKNVSNTFYIFIICILKTYVQIEFLLINRFLNQIFFTKLQNFFKKKRKKYEKFQQI